MSQLGKSALPSRRRSPVPRRSSSAGSSTGSSRSPWPRAPLSGACSFARSNALLHAVFEEGTLSQKDLLKHLQKNKVYYFQVAAVNKLGSGQWSDPLRVDVPGMSKAIRDEGAQDTSQ